MDKEDPPKKKMTGRDGKVLKKAHSFAIFCENFEILLEFSLKKYLTIEKDKSP